MDATGSSAPVPPTETPITPKPEDKPRELHPTEPRRGAKPLPTNRIAFPKQLDLLRAYAAAGGVDRKPASIAAAAQMVGMTAATASLANGFFVDTKLVQKVDGPQPLFSPSDAVHEFAMAHDWAPDTAAQKLAPVLMQTWAWAAIEPRLKFSPTISEIDVVRYLAEACGASPNYRPQLILVLQYLEAAGLLTRDGQVVRRAEGRGAISAPPTTPDAVTHPTERVVVTRSGPLAGGGGGRAEGQIRFAVSMNFDVSELRGWTPDRIAKLFEGISKVIAAKGGEDEDDLPGE